MAVLLTVMAIAISALVAQLKWANRASSAGGVARRSLLVLAGPGVAILVLALAADFGYFETNRMDGLTGLSAEEETVPGEHRHLNESVAQASWFGTL